MPLSSILAPSDSIAFLRDDASSLHPSFKDTAVDLQDHVVRRAVDSLRVGIRDERRGLGNPSRVFSEPRLSSQSRERGVEFTASHRSSSIYGKNSTTGIPKQHTHQNWHPHPKNDAIHILKWVVSPS
jgi:hypothetical protein